MRHVWRGRVTWHVAKWEWVEDIINHRICSLKTAINSLCDVHKGYVWRGGRKMEDAASVPASTSPSPKNEQKWFTCVYDQWLQYHSCNFEEQVRLHFPPLSLMGFHPSNVILQWFQIKACTWIAGKVNSFMYFRIGIVKHYHWVDCNLVDNIYFNRRS